MAMELGPNGSEERPVARAAPNRYNDLDPQNRVVAMKMFYLGIVLLVGMLALPGC
jgi:hypothetical protein